MPNCEGSPEGRLVVAPDHKIVFGGCRKRPFLFQCVTAQPTAGLPARNRMAALFRTLLTTRKRTGAAAAGFVHAVQAKSERAWPRESIPSCVNNDRNSAQDRCVCQTRRHRPSAGLILRKRSAICQADIERTATQLQHRQGVRHGPVSQARQGTGPRVAQA